MSGSEDVRSLGGLWVLAEGRGEMPGGGGTANTVMTLGFDPRRRRYTGTWVGSMMPHLWVYDGSLDEAGRVLTLDCEGPSFAGDGSMQRYRDVIEITGRDTRVLTAHMQGADGTWRQSMTTNHRRTK